MVRHFKKVHRVKFERGIAKTKIDHLPLGAYIVRTKEAGILSDVQINAAKISLTRKVRDLGGIVKPLTFAIFPKTKKSIGVRMGGGSGSPEYFVSYLKKYSPLFEVKFPRFDPSFASVVYCASYKLPLKCEVIGSPLNKITTIEN